VHRSSVIFVANVNASGKSASELQLPCHARPTSVADERQMRFQMATPVENSGSPFVRWAIPATWGIRPRTRAMAPGMPQGQPSLQTDETSPTQMESQAVAQQ